MLARLTVSNYALIDELSVSFSPGFNIITGETGAGKSVLLGALSLILGARADNSAFRRTELKCVVEGVFGIEGYGLESLFLANDLDYDPQVIVRREIVPSGKSRAFINDTPVTLQQLRDLALRMIDIHSQHQNLELGTLRFQLQVVDGVAGTEAAFREYKALYASFRKTGESLDRLREETDRNRAEQDYLEFQFQQLEQASLRAGEQELLEEERDQLEHAGEIRSALAEVAGLLDGEPFPVLRQLREAAGRLERIAPFLKTASDLAERLVSASIEIKDIARETSLLAEKTEVNPQRLAMVQERLDLIYNLQQKHRVSSVEILLQLKDELGDRLHRMAETDHEMAGLERSLREMETRLENAARELSTSRVEAFPVIRQKVTSLLRQLGMPHAVFDIGREARTDFTEYGKDYIRFLFSANRNVEPEEISRIASGGEISRLMLALKSLLSESLLLPAIVFDEIDAGISGETALKMGVILKSMAGRMQMINITHLPQIAGMGEHHFLVSKHEGEEGTTIRIRELTPEERVGEIAKMVGGEEPSENAIRTARELLQRR